MRQCIASSRTCCASLYGVGYGFNIRGGIDNCHVGDDPGIFVSSMRPDGSAAKDERLKKGDKVLSVSASL